jgi:hypothetical protein
VLRARLSAFLVATALVGLAPLWACLPGGGTFLDGQEASAPPTDFDDAGFVRGDASPGDPFGIDGLSPSHGPYTGGTTAKLAGRGFSTKLSVFVGGVELPSSSVLASDPTRAVIVTPPGRPGFVDVKIRDEATAKERVLKNGFFYDSFVVAPDSGATSGGTTVRITNGSTERWNAGATVVIDGKACTVTGGVSIPEREEIECTTPAGTPGAKDVVVKTTDGRSFQAREAFTYNDSTDGYRGGLSGGAFVGRVRVLAFNALTGTPIPGAHAIVGTSVATKQQTSTSGVTEFNGLPGTKVTVTIAAPCHQPMTFVDVSVDTVTAYLNPILDLACLEGDPGSTGGPGGRFGGIIEGQLVFPGAGEFERASWTTVPLPTKPTERRAAYVFEAATTPNLVFELPSPAEAITPDSPGAVGYTYSVLVYPGNATIYVVAGLEDRSETPARFVPYAMGVARGVSVPAQTKVTNVDVKMDILFDHQVTMVPEAPAAGALGPDRLMGSVAVTLGATGYGILPRGVRLVPLPAPGQIAFVGVPSLDRALSGEQYVLGGTAATGADLQMPASVVGRVRTTNANTPVSLGGFLPIPVLSQPGSGTWNGTTISFTATTSAANLELIRIASGEGLSAWTIVAPGNVTSFDVPDLRTIPSPGKPLALYAGTIQTTVYVARINDLDYGRLRLGQLSANAWNAHAFDGRAGTY